jgi:siderophore synthetase component
MSPAESLAYAPEFADTIGVRFAAVRTDYALETQTAANESLTQQLYEMFGGLDTAVEHALPAAYDCDDYAVVPLHPWQFYHTIPDRYRRQLRDTRVVLVEYSHPVTPLLNLRTTIPYETDQTADGPLSHLKLAIDVQTTNAVRTLSPQAVANGPQVTAVLRAIHERESFDTLGFLDESAAACYHAPGGPHPEGQEFNDARHLSALIRMNPYEHPLVPDGAVPVVVSSLLATSPVTERPLICDCIAEYAKRTDTTTMATATERFLREYVAVVVPEQLRLLSEYGIALESHPQNSYIVLDRGHPIAMLARDFGGIRVHDARLESRGLSLKPYPDSDLDADNREELYGKLYYALFNNHLAELIATLVQHTDVDEETCWGIVRSETEQAFAVLRSRAVVPAQRIETDERALFANPTMHKALSAMRLQGKRHEYVTSRVSNPLANAPSRSVPSPRQHARD